MWSRIYERLTLSPILLFLYLVLLAGLWTAGYHFYLDQQERYESEVRIQLGVIANLKVDQIADWRRERIEDGALVQHHFSAVPDLRKLLKGPANAVPDRAVSDWMQAMKDHRGFQNVILLDAWGTIRYSLFPQTHLEDPCRNIARQAMASRQITLSDLHRENETVASHLTVAVPILAPSEQAPVAMILLRTDPSAFLFPLIESWPTPSPSAESLLVRREGDRVLFLNELRHRKNTELKFSLPIRGDPTPTPAAEAVAGREGVWSGTDYRGVQVLAAARRVPHSPWYLISKVDLEEVRTPFHRQTALVWIILLLFVLASGPAVGLMWQKQRSRLKNVRRESEVERRALLEHFSYLNRYTNDIILLEEVSGRIVEANERAEQAYLYDHKELLGLNIRDLLEPDALPEFDASWKDPEGVLYETLHRRKDGSVFPVEVSARVIAVDGEKFRQAIIRDITERRNHEERLRRAGAYNRRLIEAAVDPLVTIRPDGTIADVNTATEKVTGYPREELVGTDFCDYFSEPDKARAGYQLAFHVGQIQDYELEIRHHDGHLTPVIYSASVYRDKAGEVVGVFAAARDITEQKRIRAEIQELNRELEQRVQRRTAELEATNNELEAFTYSVSHDLRAPLRAINGFSRILMERYSPHLSAEAQHYIDVIHQNASRMGRLIDDLLALSRLGRQSLTKVAIAPENLVRQALAELSSELDGRQVEIVIGEMPPCSGDPALLKQVFENLLSNALKYSRRRKNARVEVGSILMTDREPISSLVPEPESSAYYVRDNGVGFDMRYVGKLFGVFQRLHSQADFEGTGVGLAIVERIVRRHGGRVWAEAAPDKGATFFFTIGK